MLGASAPERRLQHELAMAEATITMSTAAQAAEEEEQQTETRALAQRQPTPTRSLTRRPSLHPLPPRLRISPKLRALEIPP